MDKKHSTGREKQVGFCFSTRLISTFQRLFFPPPQSLFQGFFFFARSSWQLAERGGGDCCRRGLQQPACQRKRVPSHPISPPSFSSPHLTSLLFLSLQGLVKEPIVPPQENCCNRTRCELMRKERVVFIYKVSPYLGFSHCCAKSTRISFTRTPTCTRAPGHVYHRTTVCPVVPIRAVLLTLALLFIFRCFPTHVSMHI